jgi:hypothetical protein
MKITTNGTPPRIIRNENAATNLFQHAGVGTTMRGGIDVTVSAHGYDNYCGDDFKSITLV